MAAMKRETVRRLMSDFGMLIAACFLAGTYGAIHNQISYTVSPDYFHAFKFHQFRIPPELQNRLGAALVGVGASWWMGILVGVPIISAGRTIPEARAAARRILIGFAAVIATALAVGLGALGLAYAVITPELISGLRLPELVSDRVAFARAGVMHDASYLGGFLGIVTGWFVVGRQPRRDANSRSPTPL
jgi:hypothetical protein